MAKYIDKRIEALKQASTKEQLEYVFTECISQAEYERKALQADDPQGTCAAHHRGSISAYNHIAKLLAELIQ